MDRLQMIRIARRATGGRTALAGRETGHVFNHCLRTAHIAAGLFERIKESMEFDEDLIFEDLIFAGGLFHDVGRAVGPHHLTGAAIVAVLLADKMPAEDVDAVARIVREHNDRKHARDCWAASRVVQDADILDHHGAQSIWAAFHGSAMRDESPEQALARYQSWRDTCMADERASLNYEASRECFDHRIAFERDFYERFESELDVEPSGRT